MRDKIKEKLLTLTCKIVGVKEEPFQVEISGQQWGCDVLDAIRRVRPAMNAKATTVRSYAAIKGGCWLAGDGDTALQLNGGERTEEINEMINRQDRVLSSNISVNRWLDSLGMLGTTNIPRDGQIHVLVKLPEYNIVDRQLVEVDHAKRAYENSRVPPSAELKLNLVRTYHCDVGSGKLRCMLLGLEFPSELVVACHLFPVNRNETHLVQKMMGFDDVNHVRNGLLLFKPLAQAFRGGASFIYDEASDTFRFKMFNKPMLEERLVRKLSVFKDHCILFRDHKLPRNWSKKNGVDWVVPGTAINIKTTYGDVDGQALRFGKTLTRPFKRCLNFQALVIQNMAIDFRWIQPDEDTFEDFGMEGMSLAEKMRMFHGSQN